MACADISSARCSVVGSCCCRQLGLEGFYCCGVNSIRQFVPLPCCSGEERVVVVILGAHWDLVLVAVCVARQYPPLLLMEIVSVNSNQVVAYLVHHGEFWFFLLISRVCQLRSLSISPTLDVFL